MSAAAECSAVPPVINALPINVALLDEEGTIVWTNRAWREYGRENGIEVPPHTIGCDYLAITERADTADANAVAVGLRDILAGERRSFEHVYLCTGEKEKREQQWFLMRAASFEYRGVRYVAVSHFETTGDLRRERQICRAMEDAGNAVAVADIDGKITYVNSAFEELTGYSSEEAVGRTPRILQSGALSQEYYDRLWETLLAGEGWTDTFPNRRKSGELYFARETIVPIVNHDGEPVKFVSFQSDVTDLKKNRYQLRKLGTVLRHDLRNELNVILGNAERIANHGDDVAEGTERIIRAAERLLSTVEKGRELQRLFETEPDPGMTDVVECAEAAVGSQLAAWPDATITFDAPEKGIANAIAIDELDIALEELVRNAVVHHYRDDPAVEVRVESTAEWVDVHVVDDGPGLPHIESEPLENGVSSPVYHDSGYGLNLVYWIVQWSGGELLFGEANTDGTAVTVRLPRL